MATGTRPLNLIIVFLTQYLFYYKFILPDLSSSSESALYPSLLIPFIIVTTLITAGGYYINDYFDFEADIINGKKNRLKNKSGYLILYTAVTLIGLFMSTWIALEVGEILYSLIYVFAVGVLYWYSVWLKGNGIIGNITVALFSALVIPVLLFAERNYLEQDDAIRYGLVLSIFIFFISLVREVIKDMEDINGDRETGLKTLPIRAGIERSKVFCSINLVFFIGIFLGVLFYFDLNSYQLVASVLMVLLPVVVLIYLILRSHSKASFKKLSIYTKVLM